MECLHRARIIIENVSPQIDGGRYAVKRVVGDVLTVQADVFCDGHGVLDAVLKYRQDDAQPWTEVPFHFVDNDRWQGQLSLNCVGRYTVVIEAWIDEFRTWQRDLLKRLDAGQDVGTELQEGAQLVRQAAALAPAADAASMQRLAAVLDGNTPQAERVQQALREELAEWMRLHQRRLHATASVPPLRVIVDPPRAQFAAWYEFFPRSWGPAPGVHGTFRDCLRLLPRLKQMGFDVLYLPPIHPIGRSFRKGKNNSLEAAPGDPGSPWAIGNEHGGHTAVEPLLGSLDDFKAFVSAAHDFGMEVALDFAIQCSPDHPWVREHPEWFKRRPDGSIKYAENPPKKYQDIYPLNFDCEAWPSLWHELERVLQFWIGQGIRTFRVDNPHTKPVRFWEWLLNTIKRQHPDVIFLSEAFTRPKMMKVLAKVGFTQSYTYFTWRNTKKELTEYLTELTMTEMAEYFRGHFFVNTPDILHEYLQKGGRPAFKVRVLLAATLSSLYGMYSGFEYCENTPLREGSEEYLNSEKYELKYRPDRQPGDIVDYIAIVNRARRDNAALQLYRNLTFHGCDNDQILCYSKTTPAHDNSVIVAVNLDPHRTQDGYVFIDLAALGLRPEQRYAVRDLFTGNEWNWGGTNYVRLDPQHEPGHLLVVRK